MTNKRTTRNSIKHNTSQPKGPSVTVKKEIITANAKCTLAEELVVAQNTALASNLDTELSLAQDLFANKKDDQVRDNTDHLIFRLRLDADMSKQVNKLIKKITTFTCYASDSNEYAMITDLPNQADQHTRVNRKTDEAHEVLKLLRKYPEFEYVKPAHRPIQQENGKYKVINVIKAIFSNEDSYNKVLQANFHTTVQEEGEDGNFVEKKISFKFKPIQQALLITEEQETNKKKRTIQVFDIPLYTEKKTIQNSFSFLGKIEKSAHGQYQ
ncbi:hypothetical protein RCL_jg14445.t1 [Rhizophagus clarus]|uniref:Uncharacterized protein n=1 Tax=Rhizophagus clarus TaxID=94130 RepID=A0A8H3QS69_9GLOM|nr:hypothetical protein RCL_jg14445.t1 [Rhizophagus clarus]